MLQWAATLAKLRADDWARLLGILAVAAVAIVVIWIVQRASASETEGDDPPDGPPRSPLPPRDAAAPANANADYEQFEQKMRHNERIIDQRGIHHYHFAHRVLRDAFFEDPVVFVEMMRAQSTGRQALIHLWSRAAVDAIKAGFQPLDFDQRPAPARDVIVAGRAGILFEMPPPQAPAEAYFSLALLPPDGAAAATTRDADADADLAAPRYFTLERVGLAPGEQPSDPPATVLGSWSRTAHSNHGAGPRPTAEAFLGAVASLLGGARSSA